MVFLSPLANAVVIHSRHFPNSYLVNVHDHPSHQIKPCCCNDARTRLVFGRYLVRISAGTPLILTEVFRGFLQSFRQIPVTFVTFTISVNFFVYCA
jgi:hypothetical protein